MAIIGLLFGLLVIVGFIVLFVYNNSIVLVVTAILYFVGGIIFIIGYSAKEIIKNIRTRYEQNKIQRIKDKHDEEYAQYKKEVLDNKYCYMTFEKWKTKKNNKR